MNLRAVCKLCGENVAVPESFRSKKLPGPRLAHLKKKHKIKWSKGVDDKHSDYAQEPATAELKNDKKEPKPKAPQPITKEPVEIKNRLNGHIAILKSSNQGHARCSPNA